MYKKRTVTPLLRSVTDNMTMILDIPYSGSYRKHVFKHKLFNDNR